MKTFRVRESIAKATVALFPNATVVPPPPELNGGCSDPTCCVQHTGKHANGEEMVGIAGTGVNGMEFRRRLLAAGLTE